MSSTHIPDYKERYFEYKTLTRIVGRPTIDKLLTIYKQLKRNAQTVPTTLGGGQLGYLALILKQITYAAIPGAAAFIRPTDPGPFTIVPNPTPPATRTNPNPVPVPLTHTDVTTQRANWEERRRIYNEVQAVELALRNLLIEAIEPVYLTPLRDSTTDMIVHSIPDITQFL